jgi:hypothetical protein
MTKSLFIESGALAIPEPDASGVRAYKGMERRPLHHSVRRA